MSTLVEERPDYGERVAAYLVKHGLRRLPWGAIVAGGGLRLTKSTRERATRAEIGEVAIALLDALGITGEMLDKLADLPHDTPPALLVCTLQDMRAVSAMIAGAERDRAAESEPEVTHAPDCVATANPSACDCGAGGPNGP